MSAPDSHPPSDSNRESKIREIIEEYLRGLQSGRAGDARRLVDSNPDLAPELQQRLELVAEMHRAESSKDVASEETRTQITDRRPANARGVESPPRANVREERASRVHCPHCGNEIQLVGVQIRELTCASCGSKFGFDQESTREYHAELPATIARFHIREQLGRGGFGIVYRAFDPNLSREVAVKVPRVGYFLSSKEEERFLREARGAANLRHPNIVQIHEVISDGSVLCLVSELIEGLTLADLTTAGRSSYTETAELMVQIGSAVEFAHRQGVVHRDIKPSNILLDQDHKPYLTDFGLARHSGPEITMTIDGEILGTPAYMAPEQAAGQHSRVDARSDVYSLGVTLYRMLTGELPFRGSQRMLLHQVMNEDPISLRRLNDSVPRELETITLKAMSKEKEARYQSAQELVDELNRWLRHEPIRSSPPSPFGRLARWFRRKPVVATLVSTVVALVCCLVIGSVVWAIRESGLRDQADVARAEAVENDRQSRSRLAKLYTRTGVEQMRQNELIRSLPWFVEALQTDADNPDAVVAHRLRLGMILQQCPTLVQIWDTGSPVHLVAFSPDGNRVLAACESGVAKLFSMHSGNEDTVELSHSAALRFAEFSPDGSHLIVVSRDKVATLWKLDGPERVAALSHDDMVWHGAFSSDGKWVLTGGLDHTVRIWNVADGSAVATLDHGEGVVNRIVVSPNSKHFVSLAAETAGSGWIRIWDLETKQLVGSPNRLKGLIRTAAFDRSGSLVACPGGDASVRLFDVRTGASAGEALRHESAVKWLSFLDDNDQIATATAEGRVRIWSISQHAVIGDEFSHGGPLRSAAMAGSPTRLATLGNGNVRVWWLHARRLAGAPLAQSGSPTSVALEATGPRTVVGSDDGTVRVWDLAGGARSGWILPHDGEVTVARFSPDSSTILTASRDGTGRLWNRRTGEPIGDPLEHTADVLDAVFNHNGTLCATAGADNEVKIWDGFTAAKIGAPLRHSDHVIRLDFAPASNRLATGCQDGSVRIWFVGTPEPVAWIHHSGSIRCVRFDAKGRSLAVCSEDGMARVWNVADGTAAGPPLQHGGIVSCCEFHPSEPWLLTASRDNAVRVWDWKTGQEVMPALSHAALVPQFRLDAERNQLLSVDYAGTAALWNLTNPPAVIWHFDHPATQLACGDIHPNGRFLLTAGGRDESHSGGVYLWDGATGLPLSPPLTQWGNVNMATFSPDGESIVSASLAGTAQLWSLDANDQSLRTLRDLGALLAGYRIDERLRASALSASDQVALFQSIKSESPESLATKAAKREAWNHFIQRIVNRGSDLE
ncbi:MAG: WD40 repeat domain-containing serine/threonine protein kinase [Pirellulaceae bacterium]